MIEPVVNICAPAMWDVADGQSLLRELDGIGADYEAHRQHVYRKLGSIMEDVWARSAKARRTALLALPHLSLLPAPACPSRPDGRT